MNRCNLNAHEDPPGLLTQDEILHATEILPSLDGDLGSYFQEEIHKFFQSDPAQSCSYLASSGAASLYHVLQQVYPQHIRPTGKTQILSANQSCRWTQESLRRMEQLGVVSAYLPQGAITAAMVEEHLKPRSALLSLPWADGLTGVIHPIEEIAEVCARKNVLFHVDATFVLGKKDIAFSNAQIDFLTWDGYLTGNPWRGGGILARKEMQFTQPIPGEEIPPHMMASTLLSLRKLKEMVDHYQLEGTRLRLRMEQQVKEAIPDAGILFQNADRLPNVFIAVFPGAHQETLLFYLHQLGFGAAIGTKHFIPLAAHLKDLGFSSNTAYCTLSFALPYHMRLEDIGPAVDALKQSYKKARIFTSSLSKEAMI